MSSTAQELWDEIMQEGYSEGMSHGLEEGLKQGISQGISQGAHDKAVETARLMLANNIEISMVAKCTGLTEEEIKQIEN